MVRLHVHEWRDRCLVVTVCYSTIGPMVNKYVGLEQSIDGEIYQK